jgi:hypothetical protein
MTPPDPSLSPFGTGMGLVCDVSSRAAGGVPTDWGAGSGSEVSVKVRLRWHLRAPSRILRFRQFETRGR